MKTVDSRATEKQFHTKLDTKGWKTKNSTNHSTFTIRQKYSNNHPSKCYVSYGGIAQWCTNLSPEASGELYPHVTVQKHSNSKLLVTCGAGFAAYTRLVYSPVQLHNSKIRGIFFRGNRGHSHSHLRVFRRECHLCRLAGNTVWSHMARVFS